MVPTKALTEDSARIRINAIVLMEKKIIQGPAQWPLSHVTVLLELDGEEEVEAVL